MKQQHCINAESIKKYGLNLDKVNVTKKSSTAFTSFSKY